MNPKLCRHFQLLSFLLKLKLILIKCLGSGGQLITLRVRFSQVAYLLMRHVAFLSFFYIEGVKVAGWPQVYVTQNNVENENAKSV